MKDVIERRGQEYFAVTHYDNGLSPNRRHLPQTDGQRYEYVARVDYGKRFWPTILTQEIAVLEGGKSWRYSSTVMEREAFVESWKELSQEEKLAFAAEDFGDRAKAIQDLGLTDGETKYIGLCGSPEPIPYQDSRELNRRVEEVKQKLINALAEKGVDSPSTRLFSIIWAIKEIVTEDLGNPDVGSEGWKQVYTQRKTNFYEWLLHV